MRVNVATPLLEAQAIDRRRPDGSGWLLSEVSLRLAAGEILGVVGPSGAGKTLLLRALALLDPLDGGQVRWNGRVVKPSVIPLFRGSVTYLHQRGRLGEGRVEYLLRQPFELRVHHHRRFNRRRIETLLAELGRDESFLEKSQQDLSGGEAQLVVLLRALQFDPQVLLLDEPTAALDQTTARAVEAVLEGWLGASPSGRGLVWVSHDPAQTERLAHRTLSLRGGSIESEESRSER